MGDILHVGMDLAVEAKGAAEQIREFFNLIDLVDQVRTPPVVFKLDPERNLSLEIAFKLVPQASISYKEDEHTIDSNNFKFCLLLYYPT